MRFEILLEVIFTEDLGRLRARILSLRLEDLSDFLSEPGQPCERVLWFLRVLRLELSSERFGDTLPCKPGCFSFSPNSEDCLLLTSIAASFFCPRYFSKSWPCFFIFLRLKHRLSMFLRIARSIKLVVVCVSSSTLTWFIFTFRSLGILIWLSSMTRNTT